MEESRKLSVAVNGILYEREIDVRTTLADFLRHGLMLTGTHVGCEHGVCGACTVLVNDQSVRSCLMLAVQTDGERVTTIEGIAPSPTELHPLQNALKDRHGLQCGFCTPGMVTTLIEFLRDCPNPTESQIRVAISGNLCRCTGYQGIVDAVLQVVGKPAK